MPRTNRITLNDRMIAGAKGNLYDAIVPGLVLRTGAGRSRKVFYVVYRDTRTRKMRWIPVHDGGRTEYPHVTLVRARELAREIVTLAGDGKDPIAERAKVKADDDEAHTRTLGALGTRFVEDYAKPTLDQWQEPARIVREGGPLEAIRARPVAALTRGECRAIHAAMTARGVTVYANRVQSWLRAVLNYGVDLEWLTTNPIANVKANEEASRERVLSDAEIKRYWAWLDAPPAGANAKRRAVWPLLAAWCRLRLVLLVRSNEAIGMRWDDLTLTGKRPVWLIPKTKNGREHLIPLSPLAVSILKDVRRVQADPVFVFAGIRSARDRKKVFAGAGIEDLQNRDARRTAATNLGKLEVDEFFISRVLNHTRKGQITAVYNRWQYEPEKRVALNAWSAYLSRLVRIKALRLVGAA